MLRALTLIVTLAAAIPVAAQTEKADDVWQPVRFLEGSWEGTGEGSSGQSEVVQHYSFMLGGKFLQMQTRAVFEPQEKNPEGEVHEDFGIFSHDQIRDKIILRAFYVEGFVNTFVLDRISEDGDTLTFVAESSENAPTGTKARLVLAHAEEGAIEESFFVAFPGKDFSCFSTNRLTRAEAGSPSSKVTDEDG
jgi:hypothetical protein